MPSHVKYIHTKNDVIYLQSFDDTHLALTLLFHLILTHMSWLQPRKGDLHFILSENSNYDFDVRVERCRFVGFINDVIDCRCSGCIFRFKIKGKEKDTFYIDFYFIMFLQSCCYFFFFSFFNWIIIMDICVQFIIVAFYNELITNKVL